MTSKLRQRRVITTWQLRQPKRRVTQQSSSMMWATPLVSLETKSSALTPPHSNTPPPARKARSFAQRRVLTLHRDVVDGVKQLGLKVAAFGTDLANELTTFINSLPTPAELMRLAVNEIKKALLTDNSLCLAPSCPGYHINSGKEKDIVPGKSDVLKILASHQIAQSPHRPHPNRIQPHAHTHCPSAHRVTQHLRLTSSPRGLCGRQLHHCPFASR